MELLSSRNWFEAESNYEAMQMEAEGIFRTAMRRVQRAPDQVVKVHGHTVTRPHRFSDNGAADSGLKSFPATDSSWSCEEETEAPSSWERICDWGEVAMQHQVKSETNPRPHMGRVLQGKITNFYLIQALQAVGTKPELVDQMFVKDRHGKDLSAPLNGAFTIQLYKHSQWVAVLIDDFLPQNRWGQPLCCIGDEFPTHAWATLVEKAYAKVHGSWESIGNGGCIEDALTDLTGGIASRFQTKEIAPDRLFAYLHLALPFCLFACSVCKTEVTKRNIALLDNYACSVVCCQEVGPNLTDRLVCILVGGMQGLEAMCDPRGPGNTNFHPRLGYIWMNCLDFHQIFSTIFECRLVNSVLPQPPDGPGWTPPWNLSASKNWLAHSPTLHEYLWACPTTMEAGSEPMFRIEVDEFPCEIMIQIGQADSRLGNTGKRAQVPVLLRVWELVAGYTSHADVALIGVAYWGNVRDTMSCIKVHEDNEMDAVQNPVVLMVTINLPREGKLTSCSRLLARMYARKKVHVKLLGSHEIKLVPVTPDAVLSATLYTLCGISSSPEPDAFDEKEGAGNTMGNIIRTMNAGEKRQFSGKTGTVDSERPDWRRSLSNFVGLA